VAANDVQGVLVIAVATRKKATSQPFWVRTELKDVAAFFDKSIQTIERYWVKSGMPGEPGHYDLKAIAAWQQKAQGKGDLEIAKLEEEVRYKKLKNDQTEGLLVDRQAAEQEINAMLVRLKTRVESIPDEMEMLFPLEVRPVCKDTIANYSSNLLKEMAAWGETWDAEIEACSESA
jgi:hypothetical protein